MIVLVDTSVWSLLFRKNGPAELPEVEALMRFLRGDAQIAITGIIAQELCYGLANSRSVDDIAGNLGSLLCVAPTLEDHIAAAKLHRTLRSNGVQVSSGDALIDQLCISHDLTLLTTDKDFEHITRFAPLRIWSGKKPA